MDSHSRQDPITIAHDLGPAIAAASDTIEKTRRIPEPLLTQLHDSQLLRLFLPSSVGGGQAEPGTCFQVIEAFARHDASVAWNAFVANSAALIAAFLDPMLRALSSAIRVRSSPGGRPTPRARRLLPAAIVSPADGISQVAAGMQTGWARTAT